MKKKLLIILLLGIISLSFTGCLSNLFNNPPIITPIPAATLTVGDTFNYPVEATDPDGDSLSYSLTTIPSCAMAIDPASGLISWITNSTGTFEVTVEVSDGKSRDTASFTLTVKPALIGPSIIDLTPLTATVGVEYRGTVTVTSGDSTTLTFRLVDAPSGMEISTAGVITWTPTVAGNQTVTIVVTDGAGLADSKSFVIIVRPANHPPAITSSIPDVTLTVGDTFTYPVEATDPDGDSLSYSLTTIPSCAMAIDPASGLITWITNSTGTFEVTIEVSDGELSATQSFTVKVIAPERVVMFELFEGPACPHCKAIHSDIVRLRQEYAFDELVILEEYGWDVPSYTGWGIKDVRDRCDKYGGGPFPDAYFNGKNQTVHREAKGYSNYKSAIKKERAKPAKIAISASYSVTGKEVNISGNIVNISSGPLNDLVIEAMVYEDAVYSKYRGYNVDQVVRDIITYQESGEEVAILSSGDTHKFSLTSSDLNKVKNMNNIHVVVYVQVPDSPKMEILQALYLE